MEAVGDAGDTLRRVTEIVAKVLELPASSVAPDLALYRHPKWDSLAQIDIILEIERVFTVSVDDTVASRLTTVREIAAQMGAFNSMPAESVQFNSEDGLPLFGTVQTAHGRPRGLALFCHGITSDRSEWGIFDRMAEVFANLGVASLRFDFRGHGDSALPSERIRLQGLAGDVRAAWSKLQALGHHTRLPAFVVGSSFGGGVAYRTVNELGGAQRAFLLAPVFDYLADITRSAPRWKSQIQKTGSFKYSVLRLSGEIVEEARRFPALVAPAALPVTIFHGDHDDDVPLESSQRFQSAHDACELVVVAGAGHVIAAPGDLDMEESRSWELVKVVLDSMSDRLTGHLRLANEP